MKFRKSSLILLILTLYGMNHFIFERVFFFNEILSLIGLLLLLKHSITPRFSIRCPKSTIYRMVLTFIGWCLLCALGSIPFKTNWYYFFRNSSIIYSAFGFFIGYYLYHDQFTFYKRIKSTIYGYAFIAFLLRLPYLIDRNAYLYWFALVKKNWKLLPVIGFILISIIYVAAYTSLTVVAISIAVVGIRYIQKYSHFKLLVLLAFISFCILFWSATPYLKLYKDGYTLFGNVAYVYSHHPLFQIDHNTSWRFIFWYRTLIELFPQNLLGIGIGTPLLPYTEGLISTDSTNTDEYMAHVLGTHNTYVTVFVRFGIISMFILFVIYRKVFREFFLYKAYYKNNRNDLSIFLSFIALSVVGLFNLLIETPTLAVLYWAALGFVARAIDFRKKTYELQNL